VSIACLLPVGGEDLDRYAGAARLVRAAGDEDFDTTTGGQPAVEHPDPGEVVWRDDRGVTCRRWNWRQCVRTRITHSTTTAMFVLDGLAALGPGGLRAAEAELTGSLARLSPGATFTSRLLAP
jgi:DNA/RNA-binding domain of Phe-tRNA-synthetase-like protein